VSTEKVTEGLLIEAGVREPRTEDRSNRVAQTEPIRERQVRVGEKGSPEMERSRQRVAGDHRQLGIASMRREQNGNLQVVLQRSLVGGPESIEKPEVGTTAAKIDVLAVVEVSTASLETPGGTAEMATPLEEGDAHSRVD
jgi:hypothetical protein